MLFKKVKESFEEEIFNNFHVHYHFTSYKLESAEFFLQKLEEIEEKDPTGIVGKHHKEARIYVDCEYYMLIGAYDGIFQVINSVLGLEVSQGPNFRVRVLKKLKSGYQEIYEKLDEEWNDWIKHLDKERNDYTHIKYRGRHIVKNIWEKKPKVYDIYDQFKEDKKELVKKLRDYYEKMHLLIEEIYGLLINEL